MVKWISLILIFIVACTTPGYKIAEQNMSLGGIRKAVIGIIGEPRKISQNQRTFVSEYFSRKPDSKFDPAKSRERAFAQVVVLGDRRPYDVEVSVIVEVRAGSTYKQVGYDMSEAKKLGKDLRIRLHQGREDRNIIDDFRAF